MSGTLDLINHNFREQVLGDWFKFLARDSVDCTKNELQPTNVLPPSETMQAILSKKSLGPIRSGSYE